MIRQTCQAETGLARIDPEVLDLGKVVEEPAAYPDLFFSEKFIFFLELRSP